MAGVCGVVERRRAGVDGRLMGSFVARAIGRVWLLGLRRRCRLLFSVAGFCIALVVAMARSADRAQGALSGAGGGRGLGSHVAWRVGAVPVRQHHGRGGDQLRI